ncbi:hypothetical protein LguiA_029155 [Lonicera macranthoides]
MPNCFHLHTLSIAHIDVSFNINWLAGVQATLHRNTYVSSSTRIYPPSVTWY